MKKVGITADCICDLPEKYLQENDIGIIYFYITTSTGIFKDGSEITSENILEYLEQGGGKAETTSPAPEEYKAFFEKSLKRYDEIIHFSLGGKIDKAHNNAVRALELMGENGKRVTVIDTWHLSAGMGHMIIKAVEMRDAGSSAAGIEEAAKSMRSRISTSFITKNVDYHYRMGRISKEMAKLYNLFSLYPVLALKNGIIAPKVIETGNYEKAVVRYIRKALFNSEKIDRRRLFITHVGCTLKMLSKVKAEVARLCDFEEVVVIKASATVSSNFGPEAIGITYVRREE